METIMSYVQPFFGWLFQTTLIASMVICLILLIQKTLGGKLGARWSHALWLVLLIRMVLPWAPSSRLSLSNLIPSWDRQTQSQQLPESAEQEKLSLPSQVSGTTESKPAQRPERDVAVEKKTIRKPEMPVNDMQRKSKPRLASFRRVLPILWLAGALVIGAYLLMSNFALWRIVKRDRPLVDQPTLELFEECKAEMGVQSLVVVVPSDKVRSPGLFGFIRPRLLLPQEMLDTATQEEMRYVFLHELAHLKRRDIYIGWLTSLLQVLHWFNPLVWYAFYRMRADRELACDALVLTCTQREESHEYGQAIISLVRRFSRSRPLPAMAGILESKSQLKRRIAMITQFKKNSYHWSPLAVVLIIILACVSLPDAVGSDESTVSWPKSESSISLRRVKTGPMSDFSSPPSLDGRYLCDLGPPDAEGYRPLAIRDLVTGEVRPLTEASRAFPWSPVISPESKHVAYVHQSWFPPKSELQLIKIDGTGHRVLYRLEQDERFHIRAWTPDGKKILGAFKKGSESLQLVAFSIEDGSMQVIYTFDTYWPMWQSQLHKVAISPDGRYIAYDRPPEKGSWNSEIYILDTEHQRASCVVQHPAYDKLLGWTPDGKYIFFSSDRRQGLPGGFTATNTRDAYLLPVAGCKTQGPPVLIKSDVPDKLRPKGFTSSGSYYYTVEFKTIEAAVAKLDLQTGKLLKKPQAVGQTGAGQIPAWSPDGRYLAYGIHQPDQSQTIRIRDIATGGERELDPNLPHFSWLQWSPDGKSFLVSNFAKNSPRAIYRIDADTGERLTMVQSESSDTLPGEPQLSSDGSTLYYVLYHSDSKKASLMTRDIELGHEEELFALNGTRAIRDLTFALSPDGRKLALATQRVTSSGMRMDNRISIMPAKGGEPKELWKTEGRATIPKVAWTPDGQALLFTKRVPEGGRELWLVPAGDGEARMLCNAQEMMCQGMIYGAVHSALDMHPDGQRIAFDCFEYRHEVWVMENFLPETPVAKAEPTTLRKVTYSWGGYATISPDGRYMCDVDWDVDGETETEKLVLRELATGKERFLTTTGHPEYSAISGTSERVAYLWYDPNWVTPSLFTVGLDGSGRRCIRQGDCLVPKDWSTDGKEILALEADKDPKQLVWVSAADGSLKHIVSVDKGYPVAEGHPGKFDVSPDGRFIAYDRLQNEDARKRDIFLFDLQKSSETVVVKHPANDRLLGWTPDGTSIFFASDRSGTWDGWLQRFADGESRGFPQLVRRNIGDVTPIGFAEGGSFYYRAGGKPMRDVFTIAMDFEQGKLLAPPMPVCQTGTSHFADWSPDGRKLAYCAGRPGETKIIHIRDLTTGKEHEINTELPVFAFPRWSPDGRFIVGATAREQPHSIYKVDIQTGERTELVRSTTGTLWQCELLLDGKTLLYSRDDTNSKTRHYVVRNLTTGHEKDLIRTTRPVRLRGFALSPDKQLLAYITLVRGPVRYQALNIVPIAGGEPRELLQFDESEKMWLMSVAWMPDSQEVLFVKWLMEDKGGEIWRVSTEGGEPRKVWTWKKPFTGLCVHPDGQRIAFHTSTATNEMWVMENFLPQDMGKRQPIDIFLVYKSGGFGR